MQLKRLGNDLKESYLETLNKKDAEIAKLKNNLKNKDIEAKLELSEAIAEKNEQISTLKTKNQALKDSY